VRSNWNNALASIVRQAYKNTVTSRGGGWVGYPFPGEFWPRERHRQVGRSADKIFLRLYTTHYCAVRVPSTGAHVVAGPRITNALRMRLFSRPNWQHKMPKTEQQDFFRHREYKTSWSHSSAAYIDSKCVVNLNYRYIGAFILIAEVGAIYSGADSLGHEKGHVPLSHFYKWPGTGEGAPWVEKQPKRNWPNCILTITKALTKTSDCTFIAKKVEGHDNEFFRRFGPDRCPPHTLSNSFQRNQLYIKHLLTYLLIYLLT